MKTFLITGATNGIGKAIAKKALKLGFKLIMVGRNLKLLSACQNEFLKEFQGAEIDTVVCDFTDLSSVVVAANQIREKYETIDYFFQNAGALPPKRGAVTKDGLDYAMSINFVGPLIFMEKLWSLVHQSDVKMVLHTTSMSTPSKFNPKDLLKLNRFGRIKSYAISKLFAELSYFYYSRFLPEIRFRLIDPRIVYTNAVKGMMPKVVRWATPLIHLISRVPDVVANEVEKVILDDNQLRIALYTKGKMARYKPIADNIELQELAIQYGHNCYEGIL